MKSIYSKVGVTLEISWAVPFNITSYLTNNGILETKDVFGDLTNYSPSQQVVINAYKAAGKYTVFIKSPFILSQDRPYDKNLSMIQR